jgi:hypothetical protein
MRKQYYIEQYIRLKKKRLDKFNLYKKKKKRVCARNQRKALRVISTARKYPTSARVLLYADSGT